MAYDDTFSNIIQGLGNFSQGYMQGKRMREEDAMRRAQFDQQQKMAGLQYRQAEQRLAQEQQDRQIAERSAALARATMAGDWPTASRMHAEMTDGSIIGVDAYDEDNVKITRADNKFSVVPKREYAEIMAAGNDPRMMTGAISRIMTAEARADLAAKKAENERTLQEQKDKAKERAAEKKREYASAEKALDRKLATDLTKMRLASRGAGGGSGSGGGANKETADMKNVKFYTAIYKGRGMSEKEAEDKAISIVKRTGINPRDEEKSMEDMAKGILSETIDSTPEMREYARDYVKNKIERYRELKSGAGGASATAAKPAATGGKSQSVDFARMGFQRDPASGNYKNSKGIWFKNTDNGPVFWDKSTDTWKPVPKKSK